MTALSPDQQNIVKAPLESLSVIACAGSGKTRTAVHRLVEIRRRLGSSRRHVVLLSFSNVAVQTFRNDYLTLLKQLPESAGRTRVSIETADSFITTNVLRSHGHRTMGSCRSPFLIRGSEPFLQNEKFKFWATPKNGSKFPMAAERVGVSLVEGKPVFYGLPKKGSTSITISNGEYTAKQLGTIGAYTHDLGRYWVYRTLSEEHFVLRALAHRYPHVLVDEAQDIGTVHRAILELLMRAGVQVSLIGDPDQAIYDFSGADGSFLSGYAARQGAALFHLTSNYRSVPAILNVANAMSKRTATAYRDTPAIRNGVFFLPYTKDEELQLIESFQSNVESTDLDIARSAVVCRARGLVSELRGSDTKHGQGLVKRFVTAALLRDVQRDYSGAFAVAAGSIIALISSAENGLLDKVLNAGSYNEVKALRRMIWSFVRDSHVGLPSASLVADTEWHPVLIERVKTLLDSVKSSFGLECVDRLGHKLSKKQLPNTALTDLEFVSTKKERIRIDTVHQVKGESLDAVLYLATKQHVRALIDGVGTEDGRIGYVALTRARNLFWLGVPKDSIEGLKEPLLRLGFQEWDEHAL